MRRAIMALAVAGACALAACVPNPPTGPGYVICNESGNDAGCGDPVNIVVTDNAT